MKIASLHSAIPVVLDTIKHRQMFSIHIMLSDGNCFVQIMAGITGRYRLVNSDDIVGELAAAYSPILSNQDIARMAASDNEKLAEFKETDSGVIVSIEYRYR